MRKKPVGEYIVDFFCSKLKLIVEIDGKTSHRFKLPDDVKCHQQLEKLNLDVLQFSENQVREDM